MKTNIEAPRASYTVPTRQAVGEFIGFLTSYVRAGSPVYYWERNTAYKLAAITDDFEGCQLAMCLIGRPEFATRRTVDLINRTSFTVGSKKGEIFPLVPTWLERGKL